MTREEALRRVKGYLTDIIPAEGYSEVEEIMEALEQEPCEECEVGNPCLHCKHEFEPKMGRWIELKALDICTIGYLCSECELIVAQKKQCRPFCPNCGAKMEFEPEERNEKE